MSLQNCNHYMFSIIFFYTYMLKYAKLWLFSLIFVAHIVHSTMLSMSSCILYISHTYIHLLASHSRHMYALSYLFLWYVDTNVWISLPPPPPQLLSLLRTALFSAGHWQIRSEPELWHRDFLLIKCVWLRIKANFCKCITFWAEHAEISARKAKCLFVLFCAIF